MGWTQLHCCLRLRRVTSLERGGVRNVEIMTTLGKLGKTAGMRVGRRAKVDQGTSVPPPWETFNNRGGNSCCWSGCASVCNWGA